MSQIKSNLGQVNQVATSMGHATDAMRQAGSKQVQLANRTSVKVSQDTKQSSDKVKHLMIQLGKSFGRDVAHIARSRRNLNGWITKLGTGLIFQVQLHVLGNEG